MKKGKEFYVNERMASYVLNEWSMQETVGT